MPWCRPCNESYTSQEGNLAGRVEADATSSVFRCLGGVTGLTERSAEAYKDVDRVVDVVNGAGLARKVARLIPLAVMKG